MIAADIASSRVIFESGGIEIDSSISDGGNSCGNDVLHVSVSKIKKELFTACSHEYESQ